MKRNLAALTVLGALMLGQGAPLTALARHCPMREAGASLCAVCDLGGAPGQRAVVSAGSCCRFEAANPAPQTPGIVPAMQKTDADPTLDGILSSGAPPASPASGEARFVLARTRSPRSPRTLGTILRL